MFMASPVFPAPAGLLQVACFSLAASACAPAISSAPAPTAGGTASVLDTETGAAFRLNDQSDPTVVLLDAPPEAVWKALSAVYESLGIEPEIRDISALSLGTRSFTRSRLGDRRTSQLVRCGNQGAGPSASGGYRIRLSIISSVAPVSGDRTRLSTDVTGSATTVEGTSTAPVRCASTGDLEERIRLLVLERLKE